MMAVPLQVLVSVIGLQYTLIENDPSANGVTRVSRKGIAPLP